MILWAVFGYLLGSVPFGLVITRALGLGDLRQIGSGNIGATNVLRTGSKGAALATLLLDGGKGAVALGQVLDLDHASPFRGSSPSKARSSAMPDTSAMGAMA